MIVALMGLRGAGKTTVGQALAERLGARFADLDRLTLAALGGVSVKDAWREHGEPAFRRAECEVLTRALETDEALVLALGGGTPTAPGAGDALGASAGGGRVRIVYLRADAPTLRARLLVNDPDRPSLTGADPIEEIDAVLAARDDLYRQLAQLEVNASQSADAIVEQITNWLGRAGLRGD